MILTGVDTQSFESARSDVEDILRDELDGKYVLVVGFLPCFPVVSGLPVIVYAHEAFSDLRVQVDVESNSSREDVASALDRVFQSSAVVGRVKVSSARED